MLDAAGTVRRMQSRGAAICSAIRWSASAGGNVASRVLQSASRLGGEFALPNGRRVTLAERPLTATGGRIVLVSDITETSLVRELLERNKRLTSMGEMAAVLAHQVRTPLAAALLYASQVARKSLPGDERARFADKLIARLDDMERLVADMLAFTRGGGRAGRRAQRQRADGTGRAVPRATPRRGVRGSRFARSPPTEAAGQRPGARRCAAQSGEQCARRRR